MSALALLLLLAVGAVADSPLTSIELYQGYDASKLVQLAATAPEADVARAIAAEKDFGEIAAAVSKVGWTFEGTGRPANVLAELTKVAGATPQYRFALGFLTAQVGYLNNDKIAEGLKMITEVAAANPKSLAVITVQAMCKGQLEMAGNWCIISDQAKIIAKANGAATITQDLKPAAVKSALDYLALYNMPECPTQSSGPVASEVDNLLSGGASVKYVDCMTWLTVAERSQAVVRGRIARQYYFNIRAGPSAKLAKIVLTSEGYSSKADAKRGFGALIASTKTAYKCVEGKAGQQKGKYRLSVYNVANGQTTGVGEGYVSMAGCEAAGKAVLADLKILVQQGTKFEQCRERGRK